MIIRKARMEDRLGIERLLKEVNNLHQKLRPDIFIENAIKYNEEQFNALISNGATPIFVAVDEDGNVLGHLFCQVRDYADVAVYKDFKTLFIDDLCVAESAHRQGIGKSLFDFALKFALKYARQNGCYDVTLNVWSGNDSALAFYGKMGMFPKETQMEYIL